MLLIQYSEKESFRSFRSRNYSKIPHDARPEYVNADFFDEHLHTHCIVA